ncbi:cellulase family glycosylhydrolase [Coraliomargarita sp. SDUM461004]|uniref:Cellulase family glycosylhydrolase n=1 Tax=Thalassobacterium sedimentorum TaxID=3041258 RepID=A0ABU1ARF3_9BACT|nr:cellulase family glycosylhydrolase [Coraliomargarita sp. SDUM461004]MDQ8196193.1 cellulase family glycosylhydrolase [Coraliomargarita sp. SDUM461004]
MKIATPTKTSSMRIVSQKAAVLFLWLLVQSLAIPSGLGALSISSAEPSRIELTWDNAAGRQYEIRASEDLTFWDGISPSFHLGTGSAVTSAYSVESERQYWKLAANTAVPTGIHVAKDDPLAGKLVKYNDSGELVAIRAFGVNYYDAFMRYNSNVNDTSFIEGFEYLAEHNIPVCRVLAAPYWPKEWALYFDDPDEYFRRLDHFIAAAEAKGIGLLLVLFWAYPTIGELVNPAVEAGVLVPDVDFIPSSSLNVDVNGYPTYAEYKSELGRLNSGSNAFIRHYTTEIVEHYADSPAIWAWEFTNEINNGIDHPNISAMRKRPGSATHQGMFLPATTTDTDVLPAWTGPDDLTRAHAEIAKRNFAESVRRIDKWRFITSGDSRPRAQAYHNWTEHTWTPDTRSENLQVMPLDNPDPMDTVTVHVYPGTRGGNPTTYFPNDGPIVIEWQTGQYYELLSHYMSGSAAIGKPLVLGEFGAPGEGTNADEKETFHRFMQAIVDSEVQLSLLWTFDTRNRALSNWFMHTGSDPAWPANEKLYQITNEDPDLWDLEQANLELGSY